MNKPTKIKTIIVDDEPHAIARIKNLLHERENFVISGTASDASSALDIIAKKRPDCIFLDITMPNKNGFEILETANTDWKPLIIVVSGSEEHAIRAFEYDVFDYLLKPYRDHRFFQSIEKIEEKILNETKPTPTNISLEDTIAHSNIIPIKKHGKISFVKIIDIHYILASGYYIELHLENKKHLLRESMHVIINKLPPDQFIRIHRSVIVNIDLIGEILKTPDKKTMVKMKNGNTFKVSRSYKSALYSKFNL